MAPARWVLPHEPQQSLLFRFGEVAAALGLPALLLVAGFFAVRVKAHRTKAWEKVRPTQPGGGPAIGSPAMSHEGSAAASSLHNSSSAALEMLQEGGHKGVTVDTALQRSTTRGGGAPAGAVGGPVPPPGQGRQAAAVREEQVVERQLK